MRPDTFPIKHYLREGHRSMEMFVPLSHAPGQAQCDPREASTAIGGAGQNAGRSVLDLPNSDGCFFTVYPSETTDTLLDEHGRSFPLRGPRAPERPLRQHHSAVAKPWQTSGVTAPSNSPASSRTASSTPGSAVRIGRRRRSVT